MKPIISIASGKGGTGKTTFAVNLSYALSENVQYIDADVEAPNGHIFLKPDVQKEYASQVAIPKIDVEKCTFCGKCQSACQFNALVILEKTYLFFPELCHSCGACMLVCKDDSILEEYRTIGKIIEGSQGNIDFLAGNMNEGEAKATPIIAQLKENLNRELVNIIDCSPGSSCTAIDGIMGSDYAVLVTEPTPFGLHDLQIAVGMVKTLDIPFGVVVNKAGLGNKDVYHYCKKEKIRILLEIPFSKEIAVECSKGNLLADVFPEYKEKFLDCYQKITAELERRHK